MIISAVHPLISDLPDDHDVADLFGASKGSVNAGQLRKLISGRDANDSVMSNPSGDGVRVFTPGRFSLG
jgi:hypothetical protein